MAGRPSHPVGTILSGYLAAHGITTLARELGAPVLLDGS